MELARMQIRTDELEARPPEARPEEPILAAILAAALLAYRRHLAQAEQETAASQPGAQWQAVARWQQLAPAIQHQAQRQR